MPNPLLGELTDVELLDRYNTGDTQAFGELLSRYRTPVYNFILRSVREPTTAEDLLQEAFTRVFQKASDFKRESKFTTWLYTIARNLCIDHARKMKLRRHRSLDAPGRDSDAGALIERIDDGAPALDRQAAAPRMREQIAQAVSELPEEQRNVFLMRTLQRLAFAEIAKVVGTSENTVKSRMRYALERLQVALAEYEEDARALG